MADALNPIAQGNRRLFTLALFALATLLLAAVFTAGVLMPESAYEINLDQRNFSPSARHPFGTDWIGRDMLARTVKGLSLSIMIGTVTSLASCLIALSVGMLAALFGGWVDRAVTWSIDVMMGIPHLIFLILVSVLMGKGARGIIIGVIITHWVSLARVIRAEAMQIRGTPYVRAAGSFGKGNFYIMTRHIAPHVMSQFIVGVILLFPHAILHEASITFLGFGLPPTQPAIGVILSESMGYLSAGMWWLAVMPGLALVAVVRLFDIIGDQVQALINPYRVQE